MRYTLNMKQHGAWSLKKEEQALQKAENRQGTGNKCRREAAKFF